MKSAHAADRGANQMARDEATMLQRAMNVRLPPGWFYGLFIIVLSFWVLHSFVEALLAASVTAIASWPLYVRFRACLPWRLGRSGKPLIFTLLVSVFVLGPMIFAVGALLNEARGLLVEIAAADKTGIATPPWVDNVPMLGRWLADRWQAQLAHPGFLATWTRRADDAGALLGWAQTLGQFTLRHAFIIGFAVLVLFVLYQEGEWIVRGFTRVLRRCIGDRADGYLELATRAVRASVNSMLIVALFDGFASAVAYAIAGVPHAAVWGAITGLLALVPFLAYGAVIALALQLSMAATATSPLLALGLGFFVLLLGDKIVRPVVAREGLRLPFVAVLMGCLGGFETLGLIGLVIGPVVLTLARELWEQHVHDIALADET